MFLWFTPFSFTTTCSRTQLGRKTRVARNSCSGYFINFLLCLWIFWFLRAFEKLRKATICFLICRLSVHMQQIGSHWKYFHEIWYFRAFRKSVEKTEASLKSDKNKRYFTRRPGHFYITSRLLLLRTRNVREKSCRENQNTHLESSKFFCSKIVPFMRKCGTVTTNNHNQAHSKHRTTHTQKHDLLPQHQS